MSGPFTSMPVPEIYGQRAPVTDEYSEPSASYPPIPHSFSEYPSFPASHRLPSYSFGPPQSSPYPPINYSTSEYLDPSTASIPRYGASPSFPTPQTFTHSPDRRHTGPPAHGQSGHYTLPPVQGPPRLMPLTDPSTQYSGSFPNGRRNFQYNSTQSHSNFAANNYFSQPSSSASWASRGLYPTNAQYPHAQESQEQSLQRSSPNTYQRSPTVFPSSEMARGLSGFGDHRSMPPQSLASNHSPRPSLSPRASQLPYSSNAQHLNARNPQEQPLQRSIDNVYHRPPTSISSSEMASGGSGLDCRRFSTILDPNSNLSMSLKSRGRRRGLCIGINYEGQVNDEGKDIALRGAANDAMTVREFLINQGFYNPSDIVLLSERSSDPGLWPTYANILFQMEQLTKDAEPNDSLFFHFSGHGGLTKDLNGDEGLFGGMDSVIYSVDKKEVVDDDMHELMVQPLPKGCRLTALYDACHSGTALDLPYVYKTNGSLTFLSHFNFHARALKESAATVVSWSSCRDKEQSADTYAGKTPVGAMSHAFINSLSESPNQSYRELLVSVRSELNKKDRQIPQHPQLGSSHKIKTEQIFVY